MATVLEEFAEILLAARATPSPLLGLHLLDTLGAWHAGARTEDTAALRRLAQTPPGLPSAFGEAALDKLALRIATVRNTEIDDIHMESCTTPGSVVVPVALTLAGALGTPRAAAFARGLASGYEAMIRLSLAVSGASILYRGVWPTFFAAPASAAATASCLLGLDAGQTADALAIALNLTGGAPGGPSAPSPRWILLGQAARAGVFAALAAAGGYRGDRHLLDGDWLQRTHGIACEKAPLVAPREEEDGAIAAVSYKPYCAAKQATAAIDGFRRLLAGTSPGEIESVRIAVPPAYAGMIGQRNPGQGRLARITSAAYQLALAAHRPELLDDVVRPDLSRDPAIAAFMARVEVVPDPALATYFPNSYPARIELSLAGGRKQDVLVTDALGDPSQSLDEAALRAKYRRLADPVIGAGPAETLATAALAATSSDAALAELSRAIETSAALG
jgi:2-methylcitrate dehydratase PrpD